MKETQKVQRAHAHLECNLPIGQLNIVINESPRPFETVSFYCNQPKGHLNACHFDGAQLVIFKRKG